METAYDIPTKQDTLRLVDRKLYEASSTILAAGNSGLNDQQLRDLEARLAVMRREIYDTLSGRN
jgi:hypothetical protein